MTHTALFPEPELVRGRQQLRGVGDEFIGEAGVVDEGLAADFLFMGVDLVHSGCDNDARYALRVDHIGIASAEGGAQERLESAIATCLHRVLDHR